MRKSCPSFVRAATLTHECVFVTFEVDTQKQNSRASLAVETVSMAGQQNWEANF